MIIKKLSILCCFMLLFSSCNNETHKVISVKNTLDIERTFETIELTKEFLKVDSLDNIGIKDMDSNELMVSQLIDNNEDGIWDVLLFQPIVPAQSHKKYEIVSISEASKPKTENYCYSRFVPERTDDYTWENNKVAFRVFGPTAQKMIEDSIPGGTLSSGVDLWLKKVDYPIINKWYKKNEDPNTPSYHEDTGEGLDNFHVGISRGVGGIAIKSDSSYYVSKNFANWKTITTGPIRTSFFLKYKDWDANGNKIKESRVITLDYGSNLSKFEITIDGTDTISAGLTLHEKDGEVTSNDDSNWVSYWQPHGNSELGTAIVSTKKYFMSSEKYITDQVDLSHAFANLNVVNNIVEYYAGFGWKESGQFKNKEAWENYLKQFSLKINNPLIVTLE
ncbi:DUF4861 family protein [Flavivirga eckloniae]|uniref:DUF4861 domain-containing protein n=1 Tax=Flavivirga eckloniae TaxID=1803846 RepID=A0A2K9PTZ9_9FLAO|nr:DUF4861 family protein [Flavivirga eckloniae]AUP80536.1 DUF4861 domain-containing protein [Flavivirga eckloniae]